MENKIKKDIIKFGSFTTKECTSITVYKNNKPKIEFNMRFYSDLLYTIILRLQRFLSKEIDYSFEPIILRYKTDVVEIKLFPIDMGLFQSHYGEVDEPWCSMELISPNVKTKKKSKLLINGTKREIIGALYDLILQIDSSMKNEEIESLLSTNLFAYYDYTKDDEWTENIFVKEKNVFNLKILDVKETDKGNAFVVAEDGCENYFTFVDENFKRHRKAHKIGKRRKYKIEFKVVNFQSEGQKENISDNSSFYKEVKTFEDFPLYDFRGVATSIESNQKEDYSFKMNMMNNSEKENTRLIRARIINPWESNLKENDVVSGQGYFAAEVWNAETCYEYGKFYNE